MEHAPQRFVLAAIAIGFFVLLSLPATGHPEADGPDWWAVTRVGTDDVLNIRAEASGSARKIGEIPHDGHGLRNLGCIGAMSFEEWEKATEAERERAKHYKWCKIEYRGVVGWVAGRYLVEGGPPPDEGKQPEAGEFSYGSWKVWCEPGQCVSAYQYGVGGSVPTILRFESGPGGAPEVFIEGGPFVSSGEVKFTIDGKNVTAGPASAMGAETEGDLHFPPDDITLGLAQSMKKGRALQLTVPRERGSEIIEFYLDGFAEAYRRLEDR